MLFSDVISFDLCIFHNSRIIKQKLKSGKLTSFFSSQLVIFRIRNSGLSKAHGMILTI